MFISVVGPITEINSPCKISKVVNLKTYKTHFYKEFKAYKTLWEFNCAQRNCKTFAVTTLFRFDMNVKNWVGPFVPYFNGVSTIPKLSYNVTRLFCMYMHYIPK